MATRSIETPPPLTSTLGVSVQYLADCPHWPLAEQRVRAALAQLGRPDIDVELECVHSADHAARLAFSGSPTVLVNGRDPFAHAGGMIGLSCRRYVTPVGLEGAPSVEQLVAVLTAATGAS